METKERRSRVAIPYLLHVGTRDYWRERTRGRSRVKARASRVISACSRRIPRLASWILALVESLWLLFLASPSRPFSATSASGRSSKTWATSSSFARSPSPPPRRRPLRSVSPPPPALLPPVACVLWRDARRARICWQSGSSPPGPARDVGTSAATPCDGGATPPYPGARQRSRACLLCFNTRVPSTLGDVVVDARDWPERGRETVCIVRRESAWIFFPKRRFF